MFDKPFLGRVQPAHEKALPQSESRVAQAPPRIPQSASSPTLSSLQLQASHAPTATHATKFTTLLVQPLNQVYTPLDIADMDYTRDLGAPGEYPYTRGAHPTMYRGRLWTMRMVTGFGTAEETNARGKDLLAHRL